MKKVYQVIALNFQAYENCIKTGNTDWEHQHKDDIIRLVETYLPCGSGFDAGTIFDFEKSTPEKLIFETAFHHMDEHGGYCGWTEHLVIVKPSLAFGFDLRVTGKNKNGIKDYIGDVFHHALEEEAE